MTVYSKEFKEFMDYLNDKSNWPDGPWKDEPDELRWVDEETGYECYIRRNNMVGGILLGYVVLPEGHPLYDVDTLDANEILDVHGGITCHGKFPWLEDDKMYIGFDYGHVWDRTLFEFLHLLNQFYTKNNMPEIPDVPWLSNEDQYRDINFVKSECINLAKQVKEIEQNQKTETSTEKEFRKMTEKIPS